MLLTTPWRPIGLIRSIYIQDAVCKKLAKSVITCSIENDYSEEDGFSRGSNDDIGGNASEDCIEASADDLAMCGGSVAFTINEPLLVAPYAAAGGVTSSGSLYAYYQGVDSSKINSITCKDCVATLKKVRTVVLGKEREGSRF